jgi:preprotein translocase subunit SecD
MKGLTWRVVTVIATIVFGFYLLTPSILKFGFGKTVTKTTKAEDPWYFSILPSETLKLGLDLQGGLHLVLGIDFDEVNRNAVVKMATQIKEVADQEKITGIQTEALANNQIAVRFEAEAEWKKLDAAIARDFSSTIDPVSQSGNQAVLALSETYGTQVRAQAVEQSLETLRNRIDEFGIAEPIIQRQGEEKILVQFPGVQDTGRLKDIIARTAKLSFQIVEAGPEVPNGTPSEAQLQAWVAEFEKETGTKPDPQQPISVYLRKLNTHLDKKLPKGTDIYFEKKLNINTKEAQYIPYLLQEVALVNGEDLQDAYYTYNQKTNDPIVEFQLTPAGAIKFEKATGENVNRFMAIVLDNNVHSAPRIKQKIGGGRAMIEMSTVGKPIQEVQNDARDTALVLRSGALPARLLFLEERVIGPSLGADAIQAGVRSFVVGLAFVFLFMAFYYKASGLVACTALTLNALFVLAIMAAFEGTLTLPGLAGLTLTLGMAVDANVLIFEHIREELKHGKSVNSAIAEGFSRAWSAILDGNLTTIVAGLVLISFGYGPIRGFAVTTLIGLTCSMYTAVFVTRVVFDYFVVAQNRKRLSI